MSEIIQLNEQFCSIMKCIIQFYHERSLDKSASYAHSRRGIMFLRDFPIDAVRMCGVKLWKYKDLIQEDRIDDIDTVSGCQNMTKGKHPDVQDSQQDIANSVVENVMGTWKTLKEDEQKIVGEQFKSLLRTYTQILIIEKKDKMTNT